MRAFKKGDRVKFLTSAGNWWVGTVEMDAGPEDHVFIAYHQGLAAMANEAVEKVPQSMEHQLLPNTHDRHTIDLANRLGYTP